MSSKDLLDLTEATGETLIPFGKFKGTPLELVSPSYLMWWIDQDPQNYPDIRKWVEDNILELNEAALEEDDYKDLEFGGDPHFYKDDY